jgi:hypothetical protein
MLIHLEKKATINLETEDMDGLELIENVTLAYSFMPRRDDLNSLRIILIFAVILILSIIGLIGYLIFKTGVI